MLLRHPEEPGVYACYGDSNTIISDQTLIRCLSWSTDDILTKKLYQCPNIKPDHTHVGSAPVTLRQNSVHLSLWYLKPLKM